MRLDKFLKNSRIIKRRTIAKEACDSGRVFVNGSNAKAGAEIKLGDQIRIRFGNSELEVEVLELKDVVKKEEAASMYKIIE